MLDICSSSVELKSSFLADAGVDVVDVVFVVVVVVGAVAGVAAGSVGAPVAADGLGRCRRMY